MRGELARLLLETGLLQFGSFDDSVPFRLSLEMLPSYPDVLHMIVAQSKSLLDAGKVNRLLSTSDAVPFGVGLSLEMNIPLVYSRGSTDAAVYDLVGAYDIGHPALLLTNVLYGQHVLSEFILKAGQAGLELHTVLAIVDMGITQISDTMRRISLLRLPDMVNHLVETHQLPRLQAQAVQSWIENMA